MSNNTTGPINSNASFVNPISPEVAGHLRAFGAALVAKGYTDRELRQEAAALPGGVSKYRDLVAATKGDSPREILVRTFLGELPIKRALLEQTLSAEIVQGLVAAGVLVRANGSSAEGSSDEVLRADAVIEPAGEFFVFRDISLLDGGTHSSSDQIMPVSVSTTLLWNLMPRHKVKLALDLGTGQGFLALHLSRHSERVLATDLASRSLRYAATTAAMHGIGNIELRLGSLFEPIAAERGRFDLIVSNPPFVIGPGLSVTSAAGPGATADDISKVVVSGVPGFLADQGQGFVMCNWGHSQESQWPESPKRWLSDEAGCDVLVLRIATQSAEEYAQFWHESLSQTGLALPTVSDWTNDLRRSGFEFVTTGFVIVRRRASGSGHWFRALNADLDGHRGHAAPQIQRILASNTTLHEYAGKEAELLDIPMGWAPGLDRVAPTSSGETLAEGVIRLRQSQGFPFDLTVHSGVMDILLGMAPGRPARALIDEAIARQPMNREKAEANICAHIRALLERGYLGILK